MILTIPPPVQERFAFPHVKSPYRAYPPSLSYSPTNGLTRAIPNLGKIRQTMSTPHRGLPLPGPMALPDPRVPQASAPPPQSQHYAPLSAQHAHGHGDERPAQDWYWVAKAEEDKRRQEEEKTRQEELRLEQRRTERDMLQQSMEAGVPPPLLPMIFAAIGGGNGPSVAVEMVQTYMNQLQQMAQQVQPPTVQATSHLSPELRRETRSVAHPQHASFAQPTPPAPSAASHAAQHPISAQAYPSPAYASPLPRSGGLGPSSNGYPGGHPTVQKNLSISSLPRLSTNEAMVQNPPSAGPPTYMTQHQDRTSPSPSIYFHHWQPPSVQNPPSVVKESQKTSPNQQSHLYNGEQTNSPRKRKATGPHQPAPPPSSAPKATSPSFSEKSSASRRHGRRGSEQFRSGYDPVGRTHRQNSRNSSQDETRTSAKPTPEGRVSQEPQSQRPESSKSES